METEGCLSADSTLHASKSLKRGFLAVVVSLLAGMFFGALCQAQILGTTQLNTARRGHTATLLQDGKVLIIGGDNQTGIIDQTEIYDPATKNFAAGPSLQTARTDHAAIELPDGRVLVIGGRDQNGPLTSSEIYNPLTGSFTSGPSMTTPRSGHTVTALSNGSILVAGGDAGGSAEIYQAATQTFSPVAANMMMARKFHSAILTSSGQVLIVGGVNAQNAVLNTAEVYDPASQSFYLPPTDMKNPRAFATLRLLPDSKVQIIGGDSDFSMEIFDPQDGRFNGLAYLPPTPDLLGATLSTRSRAALVSPYASLNPNLLGTTLTPEQLALLDRADHTITELTSKNQALVAGGISSAGQVLSSATLVASSSASVTTDETDYAPGTIVTITGKGFQPNEDVAMVLHERPDAYPDFAFTATADNQGNFVFMQFAPQSIDVGRTFTLTAIGQSSGFTAQTAFTDANPDNTSMTVSCSPNTISVGSATTCTAQVNNTQSGAPQGFPRGTVKFSLQTTGMAGTLFPSDTCNLAQIGLTNNSSCSVAFTPTAGVSGTVKGQYNTNPNNWNNNNATTSLTVTATVATTTSISSSVNPSFFFSQNVTFTATVVPASGTTAPTGTVQFVIDGSNFGAPVSLSACSPSPDACASVTSSDLAVGSHTVLAIYSATGSFTGSSGSLSGGQTVNKATPVFSNLTTSQTITYGTASISLSGKIAAGTTIPSGQTVKATINSVDSLPATIAANGTFSITFDTHAIPASATPYTITYSYAGDANFNSATDTSTNLTVNKASPVFSNLTASQTITYGTASISLSGKIAAGTVIPSGQTVKATINSVNSSPATIAAAGTFSISFDTHAIPASATPYTITYSYAGDSNFNSASDTNTTLTVNKKDATWTTNSNSKTYGDSDPTPLTTGSGSGFVDAVTASYSRVSGESVAGSPYHITATLSAAPGILDNYNITNNGADFLITYGICLLFDNSKAVQKNATIPIKVNLCNINGINVSSSAVVLNATNLVWWGAENAPDVQDSGNANPDDKFRFTGGSYMFNLSTKNLWSGKWGLEVKANGDPLSHIVIFNVK